MFREFNDVHQAGLFAERMRKIYYKPKLKTK